MEASAKASRGGEGTSRRDPTITSRRATTVRDFGAYLHGQRVPAKARDGDDVLRAVEGEVRLRARSRGGAMEGATAREGGQPAVREGGGVIAGGFEPERVVRGGCLRAKSGSPGARVRRSRAPRSRERTHRLRELGIDVVPHRNERCARGARRRLRPDERARGPPRRGTTMAFRERLEL